MLKKKENNPSSLCIIGSDHICWTLLHLTKGWFLMVLLCFSAVHSFYLCWKVAWVTPITLFSKHHADYWFSWGCQHTVKHGATPWQQLPPSLCGFITRGKQEGLCSWYPVCAAGSCWRPRCREWSRYPDNQEHPCSRGWSLHLFACYEQNYFCWTCTSSVLHVRTAPAEQQRDLHPGDGWQAASPHVHRIRLPDPDSFVLSLKTFLAL